MIIDHMSHPILVLVFAGLLLACPRLGNRQSSTFAYRTHPHLVNSLQAHCSLGIQPFVILNTASAQFQMTCGSCGSGVLSTSAFLALMTAQMQPESYTNQSHTTPAMVYSCISLILTSLYSHLLPSNRAHSRGLVRCSSSNPLMPSPNPIRWASHRPAQPCRG